MTTLSDEHYRDFGRTGLRVSPLGFGGAPIGFLDTERDQVELVLNTLLDCGVNVVDTAAMYLGSEAIIGETISHRRGEFILISKCGNEIEESSAPAWSRELVEATVDRSLQRLRTDRLDVVLLHSCGRDVLEKGDALAGLVSCREKGKIRFAGYSGDNETGAYAAALEDVEVIQMSVNICDQQNIDVALPAAREHGVAVMAKRPVANAAWKTLEDQPGMYREYARPYHERFAAMGLSEELLGRDGDANWPELALRFALTPEGVHTAIVGTTNPDHVGSNLEAATRGPLPRPRYEAIRAAFKGADPGDWIGLT